MKIEALLKPESARTAVDKKLCHFYDFSWFPAAATGDALRPASFLTCG